ncbi:MAG: lipoprotein signal peptidase [Bacteroidota bacterium]
MKVNKFVIVCLIVIILDQVVKMLVHYNMQLGYQGEIRVIGDWFRLHYIHNPGMAFGITIDAEYGKLFLSLFRVTAITALGYFFYHQIKQKAHPGFLFCLALILGGAIGNGIDSVFYGVLFDIVTPDAPSPWLHGMVIDMLYFPMFRGHFPTWFPDWSWFPFQSGRPFTFFSAIFNLADSAIFIGAVSILIFNKRFFSEESVTAENKNSQDEDTEDLSSLAAVSGDSFNEEEE